MMPLIKAMRRRSHSVGVFNHIPSHGHDWLTDESEAYKELESHEWDVIVVADYPYVDLSRLAPVVAMRHSLASRNNTWEQIHSQADKVITWSEWDESVFIERGVKINSLRAGCIWADRLFANSDTENEIRISARHEMGIGDGDKVVLWAPSWNEELSHREDTVKHLLSSGYNIRARLHPVTVWREPAYVDGLQRRHGVTVSNSYVDVPAHVDIIASDVIISDVSGFSFLAAAHPANKPIIQVDPGSAVTSNQIDMMGPEWKMKNIIGPTVAPNELPAAIAGALSGKLSGYSGHRDKMRENFGCTGTAAVKAATSMEIAYG